MPLEVSLLLRYLHQELGETLNRLQELYPQYKRTTIYRHMKKPMAEVSERDRPGGTGGRPRKGSARDKRKLVNALMKLRETEGNFSATDIQREVGIPESQMSNRTVRRYLNKMGYRVSQCRRKGILLKEDLVKRLAFAKKCKKLPTSFWKENISFYLDGASFAHKTNPSQHARTTRTRTWKKKGESLAQHCTAKGKKEGVAGRVARFMCSISYGRGFTKCHRYTGSINGETCREFILEHFRLCLKIPLTRGGSYSSKMEILPKIVPWLERRWMQLGAAYSKSLRDHQILTQLKTLSIISERK